MPGLSEFGTATSLPVEDLVNIAESQVLNKDSNVFNTLVSRLADKWNAQQKMQREQDAVLRKKRVYVPYVLESTVKYQVGASFPQFEIMYIAPVMSSASRARTVSLLISEYMLSLAPHGDKRVLLYGYQVKPQLLRNRLWTHLCVSGGDPAVQAEFIREDREVAHIYDNMVVKKRTPSKALVDYVTAKPSIVCTRAHQCTWSARVALAMYDRVDTNFRQVCDWMRTHSVDLHFFAIPGDKNMEMGTDGAVPDLGGYVAHRNSVINIVFPDDLEFQMSFTRSNYLEMIARTRCFLGGRTYVKEYVNRIQGYLIYKVTASDGIHDDPVEPYKSWVDPDYRDMYVLTVPVLKPFGNSSTLTDWQNKQCVVRKTVVDDVISPVMASDGGKLDEIAVRRLFSKSYTYIASGQLTRVETPLTVQQFTHALFVIYCRAFMRKFHSGAIASTLGPSSRAAVRSADASFTTVFRGAFSYFSDAALGSLVRSATYAMREFEYSLKSRYDIDLPDYKESIGYVEYPQDGTAPSDFVGWYPATIGPAHGYDPRLPGFYGDQSILHLKAQYAKISFDSIPPGKETLLSRAARVTHIARSQVSDILDAYDFESVVDSVVVREVPVTRRSRQAFVTDVQDEEYVRVPSDRDCPVEYLKPDVVLQDTRFTNLGTRTLQKELDPISVTPEADFLVNRILDGDVSSQVQFPMVYNAYLAPTPQLLVTSGSISISPVEDLKSAIMMLFPASLLMDTSMVESERLYTDVHHVMRVIHAKIDISRMEALKPESAFIPILRGHVLPNIKESTQNVISTLAKRNADTPYSMTPSDMDVLWKRVREAMFSVYFVPNASVWLEAQQKVEPGEVNIREWIFKQDGGKISKLIEAEGSYALTDLVYNAQNLHLMLKGKLKPEMDASYETAVKLPQSVQYDATGKSVALLSPPFRDLVKREQFMLKPNVMIMQRKSPAEIVNFLNMFDHRPDERGPRKYVEIDQTMFDKAQVREVAVMYLKYLEMLGLLDAYVQFVALMFDRSVSSMKAGVKAILTGQNVSGAAFTLHRNNAVSMIIMSLILQRILPQIEFMMVMGDDFTIAIRGSVDISDWENELSRMFNMNSKISLHDHGYICSQDIVHRPDGTTTLTRDVVKAALSLMSQDHKEEEKFSEIYESYADSMTYIDDLSTQEYLIHALPGRWRKILPGASPEAFALLVRALSALKQDANVLRTFFSTEKHTKFY